MYESPLASTLLGSLRLPGRIIYLKSNGILPTRSTTRFRHDQPRIRNNLFYSRFTVIVSSNAHTCHPSPLLSHAPYLSQYCHTDMSPMGTQLILSQIPDRDAHHS